MAASGKKTGKKGGGKERKACRVRLPPELHDELRRWASQELRSLNGQIEFLLRRAVNERRGKGGEDGES